MEPVEQRYVREQYAFIRTQVMARLIYPPLARRQGWTGRVGTEFTIRADGQVEDLRIIDSSGRSLLDRQALRAIQAAAPFPAPPAPAIISLPVVFALDASRH
jgi:protein TonB